PVWGCDTTNVGNPSTSSSMLNTNGTSSKKDNIPTSNSYSPLNAKKEDVENVYDETANLFTKTNGSSSTAAAGYSELVMKRVAKTIKLMDAVAKTNDPQCELFLLRACIGILKLYLAMRTCPPRVFELAQRSFDTALRSSLERIMIDPRPRFGDWKWRLATLPFAFGRLSVYSAVYGPIFDDALCVFNMSIETNLLSNPSETLPQTHKENGRYIFHAGGSDFKFGTSYERLVQLALRFLLGKFMKTLRYRVLTLLVLNIGIMLCAIPLSTYTIVWGFQLVRKLISSWMGACKPLRPSDMLLYSWDGGLDVCVDLPGSSPLTQTGMVDFVPGRAVIDVAHLKRGKYETKCAAIGYVVLPFLISSLGALEVGHLAQANPRVLHDSRYWGTCSGSYL
nr:reverse transcriptase domain-containing protein [Tanacetum cinerariifolium]GEY51103.1 reverse transcriptase domain-containing protein [Tanacetum cinerariifolium]